jgi:hypothetical protein
LAKLCRILSTNITTRVVLILIPSTSLLYLLDQGRRIRHWATRVHNSGVDQLNRGIMKSATTSTTVVNHFRCMNLQGYEDQISFSLLAYPRWGTGSYLFRRNFFVFYVTETLHDLLVRPIAWLVNLDSHEALVTIAPMTPSTSQVF